MAKEVSSNTANATLEAGEYFGVSRKKLLLHFQHPEELEKRLGRVDWADYLPMCREIFSQIGSGPDLVPLGQDYLRYQFKTRNAHFYAQFATWDKALWVTKHYMASRMIRGYSVDYHKLGPDYFHVTMTLDDSLEGDIDFLYFLTGVWTGSSTMANLDNRIDNLVVAPNQCEADIQFDSRSFASRAVHNPIYCRWKTWKELRRDRKEQQKLMTQQQKEQDNLTSTMSVISDAVFEVNPDGSSKEKPPLPEPPPFLLKPDQAIDSLRQIYEAGIQTQEELEKSQNRLRTLFDAVSEGLFVYHKGELLLKNKEAQRILKQENDTGLRQAIYKAGLFNMAERAESSNAPERLEKWPHLLITSCTTLTLKEGLSYLITVSDLSQALQLSKDIEKRTQEERQRIARDLHDGLSQLLSSLSYQTKGLTLTHAEADHLDELEMIAQQAATCMHLGTGVYRELDHI